MPPEGVANSRHREAPACQTAPVEVSVREARPADAARLAQVNVETWQHAYAGLLPEEYLATRDVAAYEQRWLSNLTEPLPGVGFLVAELAGEVATYGIYGPYRPQEDAYDEDTAGWGELYALYTDPRHQGIGAGTAVLQAVLARLRLQGCDEAALWVLRSNEASRRWYTRRGWRADGATATWSGAGEPLAEVRLRRRVV